MFTQITVKSRIRLTVGACVSLGLCFYLAGVQPASALPEQATECLDCHSHPDDGPLANVDHFDDSVHEGMDCTDCHEGVDEYPHVGNANDVACDDCHDEFRSLPHGAALIEQEGSLARACAACHGPAHDMPILKSENSPVSRSNLVQTCGECHADSKEDTLMAAVQHPLDSYLMSIHGEMLMSGNEDAPVCSNCHGYHDIRPKNDRESTIAADRIPSTCGQCHEKEEEDYVTSIHGLALADGVRESPTCTDCHGEHSIRPPGEEGSRVWKGSITRTCAGCHEAEHITSKFDMDSDRIRTFRVSYHGLAARAGDKTVANCSSCHGWHNVLSSSNPASTIHPDNLGQTCGECHPGAGSKFASVKIHASLGGASSGIARIFEIIYMILIPLVIGTMVLHNLLDLFRKTHARGKMPPARETHVVRMSLQERLQHGLLIVTFLALGYSGFALKYPDAWWAFPFHFNSGDEGRRIFHRVAALFFTVVSFWHLFWLLLAKQGKELLHELTFNASDLKDLTANILFYLKLRPHRRSLPRYSYIEKAEYWALVWGTVVMLFTGFILVFHNLALQRFPLWVLESARVVHYMEAVLACLAIIVWHFYWVIYDPDVYPMNVAWLTGEHENRNHPDFANEKEKDTDGSDTEDKTRDSTEP